jgi:hypothetical protein
MGLSCGGGGNAGGGTATSPTPTATAPAPAITIADAAPAIGQEIATVVNAALRAGTASIPTQPGTLARILQWLTPTLQAQSSNFVANCSRGGNVNIRYTGFRPVVLAHTSVVFSDCAVSVRGRDLRFNAGLSSTGYWTAQDPGPVRLSGSVSVEEIGSQLIDGSVTDTRFGGTIGGLTVGTPDTAPPPTPDTCRGDLSRESITNVPAAGFTYVVTLVVSSANCPWTVSAPAFVSVNPMSGRGNSTFGVTVNANTGAQRSGTLTINGTNIIIVQLGSGTTTTPPPTTPPTPTPPPTPPPTTPPPTTPPTTPATGQDALLGEWFGVITVNQPCSVGNPTANYDWDGTFKRSGNAYSLEIYDDFYEERRTIPMPVLGADRTYTFPSNDASIGLRLSLKATFSADWKTFEGEVTGSIVCSIVPGAKPLELIGYWSGDRLR